MATNWPDVPLSELYDIRSGLSKPASDFGSGYPFLSFKEVFGNYFVPDELEQLVQSTDKERVGCSVKRGDVFLTRTSETMHELGMSCVALKDYENATFNGFSKRLRPKPECDLAPEYVGYYLRSQKFRNEMLAFSTMSTRASLNNEMISRLTITVPSLDEQKSISHILKTLDDKIQVNRQINETLEQMAQALFKSWFVDFDPVIDNALDSGKPIPEELEVKVEQRKRLREAAAKGEVASPVLPDDIRSLFPSEFEFTEEMGWIPKGWKVSTVGECFDVTMGQSPPGSTYNEDGNGIPFFQGRADFGFRYPSNRVYCTEPKRLANKSDTLISVRAPVGDINMAADDCCIGRGVAAVRHKEGSKSYSYYAMNQLGEHFKVFESEGTVFGSINQKDFKALPQLEADKQLLREFDRLTSPVDDKIELQSQEIRNLISLRDTLLPKLISGELQIPEVEQQIAEALN